jgi:hypothetical protein
MYTRDTTDSIDASAKGRTAFSEGSAAELSRGRGGFSGGRDLARRDRFGFDFFVSFSFFPFFPFFLFFPFFDFLAGSTPDALALAAASRRART